MESVDNMAIYRNVHLSFWTDSKVADEFTPEDKYFFLYLLTNPHTNLLGCYEISRKQMSDETGYSKDSIDKLIKRMIEIHEVIDYCDSTKEVMILNWDKYNWTASGKQYVAIEKQLDEIKDTVFKERLQEKMNIRYPYRMDTTDTDIYINNNIDIHKEDEEDKDNIKFIDTVKEIVNYLNDKCGTRYKYKSKKTQDLIRARLNDGFTVDDFKNVISKKQSQWGDDQKWSDFLRPETLFGSKFEGYLNQKDKKEQAEDMASWLYQKKSS